MDDNFRKQFVDGYRMTTIDIFYYRPDYQSLVQEFVWQTLDIPPRFPRIELFLDHWRKNIDAVIKEIFLSTADPLGAQTFHKIDHLYRC